MNTYKKCVELCLAILILMSDSQASDIITVSADYDNDNYIEDTIQLDTPESIDQSWYPLRTASSFLPFEVDWDYKTHELVIRYHALCYTEQRYTKSMIAADPDLILINGTTYCSQHFLCSLLNGTGFIYDEKVYVIGDYIQSSLIHNNGNVKFDVRVLNSLYMMKLKDPYAYNMVRERLTGGISYIDKFSKDAPFNAVGFVYPTLSNPVCYIVGNCSGATLGSYIAHEAFHVEQVRTLGYTNEDDAKEFEWKTYKNLMK